jgi:RNA polymerase sigma factor (TIGR02999 family)
MILEAMCKGEPMAAVELLHVVYDELRRLAAKKMAHERPGQTLQATALVHEAYVRLVEHEPHKKWDGRRHFYAAAAKAMRRILIEKARAKRSQKRGGNMRRREFEPHPIVGRDDSEELLQLDDLLNRLAAADAQAAEVVELRVFAGMTVKEIAEAIGVGERRVDSLWAYGRAWLVIERNCVSS